MKVILTGATGMVGGEALRLCLSDPRVTEVISFTRRSTGMTSPKLKEILLSDFLDYSNYQQAFQKVDVTLFCLAAYQNQVSEADYEHITVDFVRVFAENLRQNSPGAAFCLFSAAGADSSEKSKTTFSRLKGRAENSVFNQGFKRAHAFRPGYIYPVRKRKEPNFTYRVIRFLYPVLGKLLGRSASIKSTELAKAMLEVGLSNGVHKRIFENRDMLDFLEGK